MMVVMVVYHYDHLAEGCDSLQPENGGVPEVCDASTQRVRYARNACSRCSRCLCARAFSSCVSAARVYCSCLLVSAARVCAVCYFATCRKEAVSLWDDLEDGRHRTKFGMA